MEINEEYNRQIIEIIKTSKSGYAKKIKTNPKLTHLLDYINDNTPLLNDSFYTLGTKLYWIFNRIESWNNSLVCCKSEKCKHSPIKHVNVKPFGKYPRFCSIKCGTSSKECTNKKWKTNIERYGCWATQTQPAIEKRHTTNLEKYGTEEYLSSIDCKEKRKNYNLKTFGVEYYQQTNEYNEKCRQTSVLHYGVEHPMKSPEVIETLKSAFIDHFGVSSPLKNHAILKKSRQKYRYDNQFFSSFAEIALYIWLKDNGIDFEYQPNSSFTYLYDGKCHTYHPDFRIKDQLIEIKGDQFFKEDGTMQCPWKSKKWNDTEKRKMDELYEAKHQCMLKNGVKILRRNEYKKYLIYVRQKHKLSTKDCKTVSI